MKGQRILFIFASTILLSVLAVGLSQARGPASHGPQGVAQPLAALGSGFTYQGQLKKGDSPVNAVCQMAFRLYDQAAGGAQVGSPLTCTVPITNGLFTVKLDFGSGVFAGSGRWLGIQAKCPGDSGYASLGRQELTAAPYALYAASAPWSGLTGKPANTILVAKSGGDYASIQAALNSISDATADNPYLVWVAPGVYSETVVMKPYVDLQGAGQEATIITSTASNDAWPPIVGTLVLTANVSVRDLTIGNSGVLTCNVALLAPDGVTQTLAADVTVQVLGASANGNKAIYLSGANTSLTLLNVTALAENSDTYNYGLHNNQGRATLRGGSFTGRGGNQAIGIYQYGANARLEATDITALGENGDDNNGFLNFGATAALHGGSFTARGGTDAKGVFNYGSNAELDAKAIVALGENATDYNRGFYNGQGATARLHGGSFTARGAGETFGIYNTMSDLVAESVTVLGESGTENNGLFNSASATATLRGGSFTARGGSTARGIHNDYAASLEADGVTALAEDEGAGMTFGLYNDNGASAKLRGGSFTARGENNTWGLYTVNQDSYLEAKNVSVLGEGGTSNRGLQCGSNAAAIVTQSVLEGADATVVVTGGGGSIDLSNSRLIGNGVASGAVTCTAISLGADFHATGCIYVP